MVQKHPSASYFNLYQGKDDFHEISLSIEKRYPGNLGIPVHRNGIFELCPHGTGKGTGGLGGWE